MKKLYVVFAIILNALLTPDLGVELEEEEEDVDAVLLGVIHDDAAPAALDLADILYTGHGVNTRRLKLPQSAFNYEGAYLDSIEFNLF